MSADLRRGVVIQYAPISVSGLGDNTLIAAVAGKAIHVINYLFVCAQATDVRFKSGTTALTGALPCVASSGVASPFVAPSMGELFVTGVGETLILNLSAAVQVSGHLAYFVE